MARAAKKAGKAGDAVNYITRNMAIKKLQVRFWGPTRTCLTNWAAAVPAGLARVQESSSSCSPNEGNGLHHGTQPQVFIAVLA